MTESTIKPALYLLPVGLSDAAPSVVVPQANIGIASGIKWFVVENVRTARRWLRKCDPAFDLDSVNFVELNKHTPVEEISSYLDPLRNGEAVGVMSEAGCPAVADPGAAVVEIAQREGLDVVPLVGPSSILLALMASGFNGQSFCFHGYLPIDAGDRLRAVRQMEKTSAEFDRTHIFIETPYRNNKLMEFLLESLSADTLLCVGANLTAENESVVTLPVEKWKGRKYDFSKIPAIFLIYRPAFGIKRSVGRRSGRKEGRG